VRVDESTELRHFWVNTCNVYNMQHTHTDTRWARNSLEVAPTHKIGQFRDVLQANEIGLVLKILNLAQQKETHTTIKKKCTTTQNKHKKLKPGSVTSYDIRPGTETAYSYFLHFINLSLTYLLRHLPTYLQPRQPHSDRTDSVKLNQHLS